MLKQEKPLSVFHDDNSVFVDNSLDALDYARDGFGVELVSLEDYLYLGLYKSFSAVYVEMQVANTNANTLDTEFYNGTAWTDVSGLVDETRGFTRSGFIRWDRLLDSEKTTVNSVEKHWIRIKPSADHSAGTIIRGINIVYSDDQDLLAEYPDIDDFRSTSESSYILRHQSARDDIILDIRNRGIRKRLAERPVSTDSTVGEGLHANIQPFDLLDVDEINRWSTFLALHKIFSNLQSGTDDFYNQKANEFMTKAKNAKALYFLTVDKDDDGISDPEDKVANINTILIGRR